MPTRKALKGEHLYRILFFGVIFTVVAVGVLAFWGVREVRRDAAVVAVESSVRGLSGAVTVLVNAVTSANDEIGTDVVSSLHPSVLRLRFVSMLEKHRNLVAVVVSDDKGFRYSLARRDDGLAECVPEQGDASVVDWTFIAKDGELKPCKAMAGFDQATLNKGLAEEFRHLEPGQVNWHSIYRLFASGESLLAASTLVEKDGRRIMVSYVFPLKVIISKLEGAEKGSAEKIFLYWTTGKVLPVVELSEMSGQLEDPPAVEKPDQVKDPVVAEAARRLVHDPAQRNAPFSFAVDGETWWAYVAPLSVFGDTISLGVVVPRRNIVSTLTSDTFFQIFGGFLVILAVVVLFVLHRNKARIVSMGLRQKAAKDASDVLRLIAEGEGSGLEFKQTLRFNLKAGKNGKEIEHASLKTVAGFMNSEGGTLLVGVADDGVVTGFEEDKFENDDKALLHFNNLVNQHIGTEFSRYLDTAIIEVQGKTIIRAYCMPAAAPAILKSGKNEEFYVRSGPASRQLTLSQFYEWLQNH